MYATLAGLLIAVITVLSVKLGKTENSPWAYPFILACYPLFYFGFALYANDSHALIQELIYSIPIFIICLLTALKSFKYSACILATGYVIHGIYDFFHHHLFINTGMPVWWPEFCGTIDLIIGVYLFAFAMNIPNKSLLSENA